MGKDRVIVLLPDRMKGASFQVYFGSDPNTLPRVPVDTFNKSDFVAWAGTAKSAHPSLAGRTFNIMFDVLRKLGGPTFCNSKEECRGSKCAGEHRISKQRLVGLEKESETVLASSMGKASMLLAEGYRDHLKTQTRFERKE